MVIIIFFPYLKKSFLLMNNLNNFRFAAKRLLSIQKIIYETGERENGR